MGIYEVREYFKQNNIPEQIKEFDVSSATVELAAQALNVAPQLIAKTLSFSLGDHAILILAAGDARIDNKKYRARFEKKAKMLTAQEVLEQTGHPVGGVCPFALATDIPIYLDKSLARFEVVYPAAGSPASCVIITPARLLEITNAQWVDVCKLLE